ncbi:LapA family protein [Labrys portucalensis]|uniref:LapA family protein n=1 Tax=Labrys neptuniae TaxID=376174 RepID=A0ABV6ZKT8_9HYPH
MKRLFYYFILVLALIVMAAFAIANKQWIAEGVALSYDPSAPGAEATTLHLPMFLILFGVLIIGMLIGGITVWLKQSRFRRAARVAQVEAERHRNELDRLRSQATPAAESRDSHAVLPSSVPF